MQTCACTGTRACERVRAKSEQKPCLCARTAALPTVNLLKGQKSLRACVHVRAGVRARRGVLLGGTCIRICLRKGNKEKDCFEDPSQGSEGKRGLVFLNAA